MIFIIASRGVPPVHFFVFSSIREEFFLLLEKESSPCTPTGGGPKQSLALVVNSAVSVDVPEGVLKDARSPIVVYALY